MGRNLRAPASAEVIDAAGTILIPGFVDCHRHSWSAQFRRIIPDGLIANYMSTTHQGFAPFYRPHDMYVGNLLTALGCIDAGITCVIDNSHNSRSAAHSDAAIEALFDSGIRGVHASGPPQFGTWDNQWPADLARLQKKYFASDDQLVTLRAFANPNRENWAFARRLGLKIHADGISSELIEAFAKENLLGADFTFNHASGLTDAVENTVRSKHFMRSLILARPVSSRRFVAASAARLEGVARSRKSISMSASIVATASSGTRGTATTAPTGPTAFAVSVTFNTEISDRERANGAFAILGLRPTRIYQRHNFDGCSPVVSVRMRPK